MYWMKEPGVTLLLVDNEPNDVDLFRIAIENSSLGVSLHTVEDGQQAIEYLEGQGAFADRWSHPLPDVILTDLHMPRKDGFELLRWLKGSPSLKGVPVVVFSGSFKLAEEQQAYRLGAKRFLVKPLSLVELERVVQTIADIVPAR